MKRRSRIIPIKPQTSVKEEEKLTIDLFIIFVGFGLKRFRDDNKGNVDKLQPDQEIISINELEDEREMEF